ncbi:hydrogen peroxide-inducible genes activator [Cesiribacter andamanensis]|uniref:Morphology and auto-aggregation control protein n=1 Tax=Cesiribacter andamanensis AMV16 TaxID=1279009 RepID=M7N350_9BACT|nr:hydrogen peroxide-inducible genes activator [Cesiribacter andamanensis]EMR01651.1 Morphology and auto-aggregation control protein [Cesiribacter andamanensis AMV16]
MSTITQLEYLLAVDTHRHFAAAAEACNVTQPTLSMQIKKLEEELGVLVFDRSKQPVIPTEAGKALLLQARTVVQQHKKLQEIADGFKGQISGELHLGIIPTLAPYLLPYFAGAFAREYPQVKLLVQELPTEEIVHRLKKDQLDVGLLVTPLHDQSISERPLFYEEIKLYINPQHPLARHQEVSARQLSQPDMWLLAAGHCFRSQVLNLCQQKSAEGELPFRFESGSLETLRRLVETEGGFTLLPELATEELPSERQELVHRLAQPRPLREVSLVYTRHYAKQRLLEALAQTILEYIPSRLQRSDRGTVVEWK